MWVLRNRATGKVLDPRQADFSMSPWDFDHDNWDDVLSEHRDSGFLGEFDVVESVDVEVVRYQIEHFDEEDGEWKLSGLDTFNSSEYAESQIDNYRNNLYPGRKVRLVERRTTETVLKSFEAVKPLG